MTTLGRQELTPLELRIEVGKSLSNLRYQLLQSFYNRRSLAERYANGNIALHIHFLAGQEGVCANWRRCNPNGTGDGSKRLMFVWVGERGEPLRPVASLVRLQPLQGCDVFWGEIAPEIVSSEQILENFFRISDRKLCAVYDSLGIKAGKLIGQVIERDTQLLDDVSDKATEPLRGWHDLTDDCAHHHPALTAIQGDDFSPTLIGNSTTYMIPEGMDFGFQLLQAFACPIDPLISAIQWVHDVYLPYEREQQTKNTKDPEGPRDTDTGTGRRIQGVGEGDRADQGEALNGNLYCQGIVAIN